MAFVMNKKKKKKEFKAMYQQNLALNITKKSDLYSQFSDHAAIAAAVKAMPIVETKPFPWKVVAIAGGTTAAVAGTGVIIKNKVERKLKTLGGALYDSIR
jgi:hypothetical protein